MMTGVHGVYQRDDGFRKRQPAVVRGHRELSRYPDWQAAVGQFSDGETMVEIQENVRGRDVFVVQPTCEPTNDNLMELLVMIDALRWSSVRRVTAVIPYFGYARQDAPRVQRVCLSLHAWRRKNDRNGGGRQGVDHGPACRPDPGLLRHSVDNVYASPILLGDVWRQKYPDLMVVSPDVGGVVRAGRWPSGSMMRPCDHRQAAPKANVAQVMNIIGDVEDRTCVLVDDLVDTAGTLCKAAAALKRMAHPKSWRIARMRSCRGRR